MKFFQPYAYQLSAIRRLLDTPCCSLFITPGLGKTAIALAVLKITRALGRRKRALVIAPKQICTDVWANEFKKWVEFSSLDISIAITSAAKRASMFARHDIVVFNSENIKWLHANQPLLTDFDTLILDESPEFKNWMSKRTRMMKHIAPKFRRRYALTGTPVSNTLVDWFAQQYLVDLGASFGRFKTRFLRRYFIPPLTKFRKWEPREQTTNDLARVSAPYVCSLSDESVVSSTLKTVDISIRLPDDARTVYKSMERQLIAELATDTVTAISSGVAYSKCRQIASGVLYDGVRRFEVHGVKWRRVVSLINELQGAPLLIFYQYSHECDCCKSFLRGCRVGEISGRVPNKERQHIINAWNSNQIDVLFAHIRTAARGLNLHLGGARHFAFLTLPDDLELYEQASRRLYRLGATRTVFRYRLIARSTIESAVIKRRLETKASLQSMLLDFCARKPARATS